MARKERQWRQRRRPHCEQRIENDMHAAAPGVAGYRS
ncbi:hypothetical protein GGD70_000537 [Paraburkholderia fungorum]|jgi:hypothetical protein|nr:hypothetical protein [Paraburkholderia fungorum]